MSELLNISNLHCDYQGKAVLQGLSLSVAHNEILCLLGPSGCGKTTALKAIAGLMPTSRGEIAINDKQVNAKGVYVPPEKRQLGMIFQDYALFGHLSVADNVGFALSGITKAERQSKVDEMLTLVKLNHLAQRFPHELSGGQQQRIAIARALAYSPQLLLLDEPFSNIDTQVRFELIDEIRDILKARNMSAVFVTHSKEEGFAFADKMAVMAHGQIAQLDTPQQLFNQPNSRFVAEFLGKGVYLPASVTSANAVATLLGEVTSTAKLTMPVGSEGDLFVRPQFLQLTAAEHGLGIITHKTFSANGFHYQVALGELNLAVITTHCFDLGQKVALKVAPHHLHLFLR